MLNPRMIVAETIAREDIYRRMLRYAYSLCKDRYGAEDLVQDAIAVAIGRADQFKGTGAVEAWLKAIVRTTHLMAIRARREWPSSLHDSYVRVLVSAEEEALGNLHRETVSREVQGLLGERDKMLVDLYYGFGLSLRRIAALTGSTEYAVKCHLYRLRRRIEAESSERLRILAS